jgi:pseudouridine-5'-phosphate glycosidase
LNANLLKPYQLQPEVSRALQESRPVVALESTLITHGLPYPKNLEIAEEMEQNIRSAGVQPATIAVMDGKIQVGINTELLHRLSNEIGMVKISLKDFGYALERKLCGGTTVAGTMFVAHQVGIRVFATGGIGGVHRTTKDTGRRNFDISTDLQALANYPVLVVCAGAKAILDLPATLEVLETLGVPVIGYQTNEFPAFYSLSSGLKTSLQAGDPVEVAAIAQAHWSLGFRTGILVVVPPPSKAALPAEEVERVIEKALTEAEISGIRGQGVTPFLLEKVNQLTGGKSMQANLALLSNNAKIAAQIAIQMYPQAWQQV